MNSRRLATVAVCTLAMFAAFAPAVHPGGSYLYQEAAGFSASFYLIGGRYSLYVYASKNGR